jgi:TetR/AcrR family transcriptional regulator, regulator of cefoperazone and chloramphenicol sensitivity
MSKRRYSSKDDPTQGRILEAALACISQTSMGNLSVRSIAAAAGVNVATVHYHYRTKERVVSEALRVFFRPVIARLEAAAEPKASAEERLREFLLFLLEFLLRNPGAFASLVEALLESNIRKNPRASTAYEKVFMGLLATAKRTLEPLIGDVAGIADGRTRGLKLLQVVTTIVHPMTISTVPSALYGIDFDDEAARRDYVELIVSGLLALRKTARPGREVPRAGAP